MVVGHFPKTGNNMMCSEETETEEPLPVNRQRTAYGKAVYCLRIGNTLPARRQWRILRDIQ